MFLLAAFLCVSFPCRRTTRDLFPESGNFSAPLAEVRDSNIFSAVVDETLVRLTLTLSPSQVHLVKKRGKFLRINVFQSFPHGFQTVYLPNLTWSSHFDVVHVRGQKLTLLAMHKMAFPSSCFLPTISKQNLFELSLPQRSCNEECPYNFFPEEPVVLQHFATFWATCDVADVSICQDTQT